MDKRAFHPTILFRTDANGAVGAGHLMRCLALAEAFRKSGRRPFFVTKETSPEMRRLIRGRRFGEVVLPANLSADTEGALMAAMTSARDAQGIVVDRYGLPASYLSSLRRLRPEWAVLQFEDLGTPLKGVDLVLNQNFYATRAFYRRAPAGVKFLLGPRHAVLRPEFLSRKPAARGSKDVRRVVVTAGGGNQPKAMSLLVRCVAEEAPGAEVTVVSGFTKVLSRSRLPAGSRVRITGPVKNMAALLRRSDLAVSAAGTTLYELSYLGIPAVCFVLADNQKDNARSADRAGVAISLGNIESASENSIRRAVRRLVLSSSERAKMRRKQLKSVDGRGPQRVVAAFDRVSR